MAMRAPNGIMAGEAFISRSQIEKGRQKTVLHNTSACEVYTLSGTFGVSPVDDCGPTIVVRRTKITGN